MVVIESSGITDVGKKRKNNEDSYLVDDDLRIYVVADGMGGHKAGEVASQIVVKYIREYMESFKDGIYVKEVTYIDNTLSDKAHNLTKVISLANHEVYKLSNSDESYSGMGSTVSAAYLTDNHLIAINVGDSPIYMIREGEIKTLSVPHTMVAEHAAIAPQGAKPLGKQFRHILTRAMGIAEIVKPDICEIKICKGDAIVISSDGLSDKVSPEEILEVVNKEKPDKACLTLVDMANERGGEDNITVIVMNIKDGFDDSLQKPSENLEAEAKEEPLQEKQQIVVDYDTEDGSYRSYINRITDDFVFIETGESFVVGQEISLTFSIGSEQASFIVNGKVTNRVADGIEVKFENLTHQKRELIKDIQKKM